MSFSDTYKQVTLELRPMANNNIMRGINITRNDGKKIDMKEIQELDEYLQENLPNNFMLRVMGPTRWSTLKGYDGKINLKSEEDYFQGKVKDVSKFNEFFSVQIETEVKVKPQYYKEYISKFKNSKKKEKKKNSKKTEKKKTVKKTRAKK